MKSKRLIFSTLAMILILSSCTFFTPKYKEGVYEGEAQGYKEDGKLIRLSITIDSKGKIRDVKVLDHDETREIGGEALKTLVSQVLNNEKTIQELEIDNVSNATETSNGFKKALKNALEKAKNK